MKAIDLGQSPARMEAKIGSPKKYYPTIRFSDDGIAGVASFDDKDIGKTMKVTAQIKLVSIESRSDSTSGKKFDYSFEVHNIEMPDDLSKQKK